MTDRDGRRARVHAELVEDGRDYWDRHSRNYDRSMALLGKPLPRMCALVAEATRGTDRVLEVAAGTGLVTIALASSAREVVATDYSPEMVSVLEQRVRNSHLENVHCEQADIYALRFEPATFDAVVAANVLHLVPNFAGALQSLRAQLRPGGRLIVPTFCHDESPFSWLLSRVLAVTGFPGRRRFRFRTLQTALEGAELRLTRAELISGPIPIGYFEGTFS